MKRSYTKRCGPRTKRTGGHLFEDGRDPTYLKFIGSLPCAACTKAGRAQTSRTEACHVKSRGAGGVDVGNTIPLCHECHMNQHTWGIKTFQRRSRLNMADLALQLGIRYGAAA